MMLSDVEARVNVARKAGCRVEELDYGWTTVAYSKKNNKNVVLTEVYRSERDGYRGAKMIEMDLLREWLKENT